MKTFRTSILALLAIFCSAYASFSQKVGYTDGDLILYSLPEAKEIQTTLDTYKGTLTNEIDKMNKEFEVKYKELEKMAQDRNTPQVIIEQKQKELQTLQQNIMSFQQKAEQDLMNKQAELLQPVNQKIQKSIDKIAKENGFVMIISQQASGFPILLYADPAYDITNLVIKDLGGTPIDPKTLNGGN